jgi:hypothetical protein
MPGNVGAATHPDAVVASDMIEKTLEPGCPSRMTGDAQM